MIIERIVCYMIRKKLNLKLFEEFQFKNQWSKKDYYYFNTDCLKKVQWKDGDYLPPRKASVSLNHLLSDEVEIKKVRR